MIYNIQRFILFILFFLIFLFYAIFSYYFIKQEEEIATVILKSLKNNITETSYTLSKSISKKKIFYHTEHYLIELVQIKTLSKLF